MVSEWRLLGPDSPTVPMKFDLASVENGTSSNNEQNSATETVRQADTSCILAAGKRLNMWPEGCWKFRTPKEPAMAPYSLHEFQAQSQAWD